MSFLTVLGQWLIFWGTVAFVAGYLFALGVYGSVKTIEVIEQ